MRAAFSAKCGAGYRRYAWRKWGIRRLHNILPKCSAKYFAVKNVCDVIRSVRSYPAKYYFAAEQASGVQRGVHKFGICMVGVTHTLPYLTVVGYEVGL